MKDRQKRKYIGQEEIALLQQSAITTKQDKSFGNKSKLTWKNEKHKHTE